MIAGYLNLSEYVFTIVQIHTIADLFINMQGVRGVLIWSSHRILLKIVNPIGARTILVGYFSMKKGDWRFGISWLFLIHYNLSENQKKCFFSVSILIETAICIKTIGMSQAFCIVLLSLMGHIGTLIGKLPM